MTRDKLRNIFQSSFSYENWQSVLASLFSGVGKNCQLSLESTPQQMPIADDEKMDGFYIGEIRIGMESVKLYTFHIKDDRTNISRNRVGLRNTVNYLRDVNDAAIVVYYNDHQWRVSYICDIIHSLKRFSFVFGDQQTLYTTPIKRFENLSEGDISLDSILEAFSVEALSKDFFKSYKAQYDKFCSYIGSHIKSNRDYVKKMMGRLVFLQFLQKKGWMNGDYNFLQNLYANSEYKEDYLESVLEPLFFGILNTKLEEREQIFKKNGWDLSLLKEWERIQYLNGGLFEADNNDKKKVTFDVKLFADLFDFFSQYNFTIDENDPNDAEVGIDPEILGHIFENLLEDNKDKGAFYTPKEIVQYMCRQSLIEYLQSKLGKHTEIENFINHHDTGNRLDGKNYIAANAKAIEELLDNVKICDPAIGSGAFPMGILNEIFQAKMALDMTLDRAAVKKNIIQNSIYGVDIEQGAVDIARLRFWLSLVVDESEPQPLPNLDYKIMCGNSLLSRYALDMPFEDVFIKYNEGKSKLERMSLEKYKKYVSDYTLTSDHKQKTQFRKTIEDVKSAFRTFMSDKQAFYTSDEQKLLTKYAAYLNIGAQMLFEFNQDEGNLPEKAKKELAKIRNIVHNKQKQQQEILNNQLYKDAFEWRFEFPQLLDDDGNFVGFDIVIGNPPYIQIKWLENKNTIAEQQFETFDKNGDIYCLFYELSTKILTYGGVGAFITSNKWMRASYGERLRNYLISNASPTILLDFGSGVFESATVDTNILIWGKRDYDTPSTTLALNDSSLKNLDFNSIIDIRGQKTMFIRDQNWSILDGKMQSLKSKIDLFNNNLSNIGAELYYGILTGANKAFLIDKVKAQYLIALDSKNSAIIKPILRGQDIERYWFKFADKYLINVHNGIKTKGIKPVNIESEYPTLLPYFDGMGDNFKIRGEQGDNWYNLRNCAYMYEFDNPKIIYADIVQNQGKFYYDELGYYTNDTAFIIVGKNLKPLTAILNSTAFSFFYKTYYSGGGLGDTGLRYKKEFLSKVPLPNLNDNSMLELETVVDKILEAKKADPTADIIALEAQIDQMVYALYNLTPDEITIIEK